MAWVLIAAGMVAGIGLVALASWLACVDAAGHPDRPLLLLVRRKRLAPRRSASVTTGPVRPPTHAPGPVEEDETGGYPPPLTS